MENKFGEQTNFEFKSDLQQNFVQTNSEEEINLENENNEVNAWDNLKVDFTEIPDTEKSVSYDDNIRDFVEKKTKEYKNTHKQNLSYLKQIEELLPNENDNKETNQQKERKIFGMLNSLSEEQLTSFKKYLYARFYGQKEPKTWDNVLFIIFASIGLSSIFAFMPFMMTLATSLLLPVTLPLIALAAVPVLVIGYVKHKLAVKKQQNKEAENILKEKVLSFIKKHQTQNRSKEIMNETSQKDYLVDFSVEQFQQLTADENSIYKPSKEYINSYEKSRNMALDIRWLYNNLELKEAEQILASKLKTQANTDLENLKSYLYTPLQKNRVIHLSTLSSGPISFLAPVFLGTIFAAVFNPASLAIILPVAAAFTVAMVGMDIYFSHKHKVDSDKKIDDENNLKKEVLDKIKSIQHPEIEEQPTIDQNIDNELNTKEQKQDDKNEDNIPLVENQTKQPDEITHD